MHCVKSIQIQSFFWSVFSRIRPECGEIFCISPYSVRMRKNTDQKNSVFGHVSCSDVNFENQSLPRVQEEFNIYEILRKSLNFGVCRNRSILSKHLWDITTRNIQTILNLIYVRNILKTYRNWIDIRWHIILKSFTSPKCGKKFFYEMIICYNT